MTPPHHHKHHHPSAIVISSPNKHSNHPSPISWTNKSSSRSFSFLKVPPADPKFFSKTSMIQLGYGVWINMTTMITGFAIGFTAAVLPQMQHEDSKIKITLSQAAWIASLLTLCVPLGSLLGGILMDTYGRQPVLVLCGVPVSLGWFCVGLAKTLNTFIIGCVIISVGLGMMLTAPRAYITEITLPNMRGVIGAMPYFFLSIGFVTVATLVVFIEWQTISYICGVYSIILTIFNCYLPETPHFVLLSSPEKVIENLRKFRSKSFDVENEMEMLLDYRIENDIRKWYELYTEDTLPSCRRKVNENVIRVQGVIITMNGMLICTKDSKKMMDLISMPSIMIITPTFSMDEKLSFGETIITMFTPSVCKPFAISLAYILLMLCSGCIVVIMWTVEMLELSNIAIVASTGNFIICVTRIVIGIMTSAILYKAKRRVMAIISSAGVGFSAIGLSLYLHTQVGRHITPFYFYMAYISFAVLGYYTLPLITMYEILPLQLRGVLSGINITLMNLIIFGMNNGYPYVLEAFGLANLMAIFGAISLIGTIILFYFLPETSEVTLQEIEEYFGNKRPTLVSSRAIQSDQFVSMMKASSSQVKGEITSSVKLTKIKSRENKLKRAHNIVNKEGSKHKHSERNKDEGGSKDKISDSLSDILENGAKLKDEKGENDNESVKTIVLSNKETDKYADQGGLTDKTFDRDNAQGGSKDKTSEREKDKDEA